MVAKFSIVRPFECVGRRNLVQFDTSVYGFELFLVCHAAKGSILNAGTISGNLDEGDSKYFVSIATVARVTILFLFQS